MNLHDISTHRCVDVDVTMHVCVCVSMYVYVSVFVSMTHAYTQKSIPVIAPILIHHFNLPPVCLCRSGPHQGETELSLSSISFDSFAHN